MICRNSYGFTSLLPLIIVAIAAVSTTTPLLVENLLNGNPPGSRIASNETQQIAQLKKVTLSGTVTTNPKTKIHHIKVSRQGSNETGSFLGIGNSEAVSYSIDITGNGTRKIVYSAYKAADESVNSLIGSQTLDVQLGNENKTQNVTIIPLTDEVNEPEETNESSSYSQIQAEINKIQSELGSVMASFTCSNSFTMPSSLRNYSNITQVSLSCETSCANGECYRLSSKLEEAFRAVNTKVNGLNITQQEKTNLLTELQTILQQANAAVSNSCSGGEFCYANVLRGSGIGANPPLDSGDEITTPAGPTNPGAGWCADNARENARRTSGTCDLQNETEYDSDGDAYCAEVNPSGPRFYRCNEGTSTEGGAGEEESNQPATQSGPISGTINVIGSLKATSVKVSVNGKEYATNKDTGDTAWKFTTDSLSGNQTVTATATLTNGDTLTEEKSIPAGTTDAEITINTYTKNIITEKCGDSGVVEDATGSGFQYTACLGSEPTTSAQAAEGQFNANEASKTEEQGNKYCGQKAYDVYACEDGSIETILVDEDNTCSKLPWCPKDADETIQPDPCAGPEKGEACSCTPDNASSPTFSQGNCSADLFCAPGKNPAIPGFACCPSGEQFCPATNSCVSRFADCGTGTATATPIPTQFQGALGCPNVNPDGTRNICSSSASGQPADGFASGSNALNSSKTYTRRQNGDSACADFYASFRPTVKYCWTESGSSGQANPGGGQGGTQPGSTAGIDGKACTQDSDCAVGFSSQGNRKCSNSFINNQGGQGPKACCDFTQRWCTLNNKCVNSASECVAPQTGSGNPGGGSKTGTGTEFEHCYNGDADCAPQYKCNKNPGDATSYCVYRNPGDTAGTAYCATSKNHCETGTTCKSGNRTGILKGDDYSCQKAGMGDICCTGTSTTTGGGGSAVITPHPAGCPNPNGKSACVAANVACPNGTYDSGDASRGKACSLAVSGTGKCCVENGVSLASSQIASVEDYTCNTSRDCTNSGLGNACIYFGGAETGICQTR